MSDYGRLWEKVDRIRSNLKEIARVQESPIRSLLGDHPWAKPSITPLIGTNTLDDAKRCVALLTSDLNSLISQWEEIEKEMKLCDDHTGNR